jgi:hypothetical protein
MINPLFRGHQSLSGIAGEAETGNAGEHPD